MNWHESRSEMGSLRADVAADLHNLDARIDGTRKDLSEQIVGLRRAVIDDQRSVIGHGTLIAGFSQAAEQWLRLSPRTSRHDAWHRSSA